MKTYAAALLLATLLALPGAAPGQMKIGWFNSAAVMRVLPE